jgi:DNA-3-methyladenine glycosylase II
MHTHAIHAPDHPGGSHMSSQHAHVHPSRNAVTPAAPPAHFSHEPSGPFTLATTGDYFGRWLALADDPAAIAMAFPVEGWHTSAAVIGRQSAGGAIHGEVVCAGGDDADGGIPSRAWRQALAVLSLDCDGSGWPVVGQRDPVIGDLQQRYRYLRPVLFHSPYEAAANFIIGHRISMAQSRAIRQAIARAHGDQVPVGETTLPAFPRPQVLRELTSFSGVSAEKIERLHAVAQAALDGLLDRAYLRSLPPEQALDALRTLPGVGPFFAQGILLRGAGMVDALADDDVTHQAIQRAYALPQPLTHAAALERADAWRPYRMWASVLLHVWLRREAGGPRLPPRSRARSGSGSGSVSDAPPPAAPTR